MAAGKSAVLFDDIIQADRERRRNEELARRIFRTGDKQTSNRSYGSRRSGGGLEASLASRIGVAKINRLYANYSQRAVSSSPTVRSAGGRGWGSDSHHHSNPQNPVRRSRQEYLQARNVRSNSLRKATPSNPRENASPQAQDDVGPDNGEINIRGTAPGPYLVIGSNFAPGTTAADIESAMQPSGGTMLSCTISQLLPTVTAELIFAEKENADNVIATFNNKKADGRIISLYIGKSGPSILCALQENTLPEPKLPRIDPARAQSPTRAAPPPRAAPSPRADLTVTYNTQREASDRSRARRADPEFQDGSYGFQETVASRQQDRMDVDGEGTVQQAPPNNGRLYSDELYQRRGRGYR